VSNIHPDLIQGLHGRVWDFCLGKVGLWDETWDSRTTKVDEEGSRRGY
jgi:hypothetical protein